MAFKTKFNKKEQKAYQKLRKHQAEEDEKYHKAYMKKLVKRYG